MLSIMFFMLSIMLLMLSVMLILLSKSLKWHKSRLERQNHGHSQIFMFLLNCFGERVDFYVTLMAENCLKNVMKRPLHKFYKIDKDVMFFQIAKKS